MPEKVNSLKPILEASVSTLKVPEGIFPRGEREFPEGGGHEDSENWNFQFYENITFYLQIFDKNSFFVKLLLHRRVYSGKFFWT